MKGSELITLIKIYMVRGGRDDFVNYLAEILGITKQAAGKKLQGKTRISENDMKTITAALNFKAKDLKKLAKD